jgi:hypothetical protein
MHSNTTFTKSVGTLRLHNKTKERSPDLTETIKIHRALITALGKHFAEHGAHVVECNLAAWHYQDKTGPLLNVQLSERYEAPRQYQGPENIFDLLAKQQEDDND